MAMNAGGPSRPLSPGSDYSEPFSIHQVDNRKQHPEIDSRYSSWLRRVAEKDAADITDDLRTQVSFEPAPFSRSPYISEGHFERLLGSVRTRKALLNSPIPGDSLQSMPPGWLVTEAKSIVGHFVHVEQLCPDESTTAATTLHTPHLLASRLTSETLEDVFNCLQMAQMTLSSRLWFSDVPQSAKLPFAVLNSLRQALNRWKFHTRSTAKGDIMVRCYVLSHLLVCAWEIADIATEAEDRELMRHAVALVDQNASDLLHIIMYTRIDPWLWHRGEPVEGDAHRPVPIDDSPVSVGQFVSDYAKRFRLDSSDMTYAVDAVIIVYHLTKRFKLEKAAFKMDEFLHQLCWASTPRVPLVQPAFVVAVVRLLHPLTRLNATGTMMLDGGFDICQLITPAVQGFLCSVLHEGVRGDRMLRYRWTRTHKALMVHCIVFLSEWQQEEPELLVKSMFSVYAKNDLKNLDTDPEKRQRRSPFTPESLATIHDTQTDFEMFLVMVVAFIRKRAEQLHAPNQESRGSAIRRISDLVQALLPNNTLPFQNRKKIEASDYISIWNHYDLYMTLWMHIPTRARLELRSFRVLVDFETCALNIRCLTIEVWTDMACYALSISGSDRAYDLPDLEKWTFEMSAYLIETFQATTNPMADEPSADVKRKTNETRSEAWSSMAAILQGWKVTLEGCPKQNVPSINPAQMLTDLRDFISLTDDCSSDDDTAPATYNIFRKEKFESKTEAGLSELIRPRYQFYVAALQLLAVFRNHGGLYKKYLMGDEKMAPKIVSKLLSCEDESVRPVLRAITESWYKFASAGDDVDWDRYLSAPSSLSFTMLADTEHSRNCKVLFMARIIQDNPMAFTEARSAFYPVWIESLFVPERWMAFEDVLSKQIYYYDETKDLLGKALGKYIEQASKESVDPLERLKVDRLSIAKALIKKMYDLEINPPTGDESQMSDDGFPGSGDLAKLLKVMTDTMKSGWRSLGEQEKVIYRRFVDKVIDELQVYPFDGYSVDKWFTDPLELEFPSVREPVVQSPEAVEDEEVVEEVLEEASSWLYGLYE